MAKVQVLSVLQLFNGNVILTVSCADTGSFTVSELYACYIMMRLHAEVISPYNHHRTRVCRDPKQEVQEIRNTDVSHITSSSVFLHIPFIMAAFSFFYDRVFAYSN